MSTFINNLRQEVLDRNINQIPLGNDLLNLNKVHSCGASEAVVFYCARLLELILNDTYRQFFGEDDSKPALVQVEKKLFEYNLLRQSSYYWAKGLRLLGNEVRHVSRSISADEAECAIIFLERILTWYFCEFPLGSRQATIYKAQSSNLKGNANRLLEFAWALDSNNQNLQRFHGPQEGEYGKYFSQNFVFPLLLGEVLLSQGDHASAARLVEAIDHLKHKAKGALRNRFEQLKGLLFSRTGHPEEAVQILEAELKRQRNDRFNPPEDETMGILAGAYKHLWEAERGEEYLCKSYETYREGWRRTDNTYLGINAATTAHLLNERSSAREIARKVISTLKHRQTKIQEKTGSRYDLNYWDQVTLAEANLLSGATQDAATLYKNAFNKFGDQIANLDVTRKQIVRIVANLKLTPSERTLLLLV